MAFEMKSEAELVVGARPAVAVEVGAELEGLVDLGVGEGLVLALVPAEAAEGVEVGGELLLEVEAEAVLDGAYAAGVR